MSEKAKINLGDIQCECLKRSMDCEKGGIVCDYRLICRALKNEMPLVWDLRDPPRFNEAQMALLKAFKGVGAERVRITVYGQGQRTFDLIDRFGNAMAFTAILGISGNETLDLAELLGKDGAE